MYKSQHYKIPYGFSSASCSPSLSHLFPSTVLLPLLLKPLPPQMNKFLKQNKILPFFPPSLRAIFSVEADNQRLEISLRWIQFCEMSWNNDTKRLYKETANFCAGRDNEQMIPQVLAYNSPLVREHVFWANYALCKQSFKYLNTKKSKNKPPQLCITSPDKQKCFSSAYDINIYFCRAMFWSVFFSHWCLRIFIYYQLKFFPLCFPIIY